MTHRKAHSSGGGGWLRGNQRSSATSSAAVGSPDTIRASQTRFSTLVASWSVSVRIQVGAEELARLHLDPCLLEKLAPEAVERMLALVEETAERVPETRVGIVRSAREQHASCVVDDEC